MNKKSTQLTIVSSTIAILVSGCGSNESSTSAVEYCDGATNFIKKESETNFTCAETLKERPFESEASYICLAPLDEDADVQGACLNTVIDQYNLSCYSGKSISATRIGSSESVEVKLSCF